MMKLILQNPDTVGALASTLCVIHCLATPFIFIAHTYAVEGGETSASWWRHLDYVFLIISFLSVARSATNTSKSFMKLALWLSWGILCLLILNEKIQLSALPEMITYVTALSLAVLHIYNLKYCQCKTHTCCTQNG